jgi:uncharacterized OB-fold protein
VRGGDGNVPTYSAFNAEQGGKTLGESCGFGKRCERTGEAQFTRLECCSQPGNEYLTEPP